MTLTWAAQLGWIGLGAAVVMFALWLRQTRTRDATAVDVGWSLSIGAAAVFVAITGGGDAWTRGLLAVLASVWAVRLGGHLLIDRIGTHKAEDGRYAALRKKFEPREQPIFLLVYAIQGLLVVLLSVPFVLGARDEHAGIGVWDVAGGAVWLLGWTIESIADRQLRAFKRETAGGGGGAGGDKGGARPVCERGLWRYSRHPNFFGEWLMWCGYAVIATPSASGILAWSAPLLMLVLITRVSGIPPTEAQAVRSRGEAYRSYQRRVSAFVPWFPKREA